MNDNKREVDDARQDPPNGLGALGSMVSIILAAGHGKRMHTDLPKVMHQVAGKPMIFYPVHASLNAGAAEAIVVVGHQRDLVTSYLRETFDKRVSFAVQHEQKGTAHAAMQALSCVPSSAKNVLILCGDTPLIQSNVLATFVRKMNERPDSILGILTCLVDDPTGYGRIVRDASGDIIEIREHRDLKTNEQLAIREINAGIYLVKAEFFRRALVSVNASNAQGEFYLTDIVHMAAAKSRVVDVVADSKTLLGVNDLVQLADVNRQMQTRLRNGLRHSGVVIDDSAVVDFDTRVMPNARIEKGVVLRGKTVVEQHALVDVGCVVQNSVVEREAVLMPYAVVRNATIGAGRVLAPMTCITGPNETSRT